MYFLYSYAVFFILIKRYIVINAYKNVSGYQ